MSTKNTPDWALLARVVGVCVGVLVAAVFAIFDHPFQAVGFGVIGAAGGGFFFRAIADPRWFTAVVCRDEPAAVEEAERPLPLWTPADLEHRLSPFARAARTQEFAAVEPDEREVRLAAVLRARGRRLAGLTHRSTAGAR